MYQLFKSKFTRARRVYRAKNINASENSVQTISLKDKEHSHCVVCLCIGNRIIKKKFISKWKALNETLSPDSKKG